jgi:hypothetical protein
MKASSTTQGLKDEIRQIRAEYPNLRDDSAFVLWFLRAYVADSEEMARGSLTGDTSDKGIDAILMDHGARQVHLVQGKYRLSLGECNEKRNDVLDLANKALMPWATQDEQRHFYSRLSPITKRKFQELVRCVRNDRYTMSLYYVTTGRCSSTIRNEARERARRAEGNIQLSILDWVNVSDIFKDYLEGIAPGVPSLVLRIDSGGSVQSQGRIYRFDPNKQVESWVFSMSAKDVGEMFDKAKSQLFARNIRGYLGDTEINKAITATVTREPQNFWYYNNGITIVCDAAKQEEQKGQNVLRVERPQVVNGQQTVRTLSQANSPDASVLVKVIVIPREGRNEDEYDDLIRNIVRATNWQNAIKPSDLVSNDKVQVFLERELRKVKYHYLRKRQTKREAQASYGMAYRMIKKDEIAQAVAACMFDSVVVRRGKEGLFDDEHYRSIFGSRDVSSYLAPYWLMRRVQQAALGKPRRAYAKWLVLHFAWKKLSPYIASGDQEFRFRRACESKGDAVLSPLNRAIDSMFKSADSFFQLERGVGEEAKDESTFFQLTKLDGRFAVFWNSRQNRNRDRAEADIVKFKEVISKYETS